MPGVARIATGEISDRAHRRHCKIAKCAHPAVYVGLGQGWCARCRCVAFGDGDLSKFEESAS